MSVEWQSATSTWLTVARNRTRSVPWLGAARVRIKAGFDEAAHPRDETGKFAEGGGSGEAGMAAGQSSPLSNKEAEAVGLYQSTGYRQINGYLRGVDEGYDGIDADIATLDKVVSNSHLAEPMTVYRGGAARLPEDPESAIGSIVTDNGFVSTSSDEVQGRRFAMFRVEEEKPGALWEIHLPKGAAGRQLSQLRMGESETLLPRGFRFKILKVATEPLGYGEDYATTPITRVVAELVL